MEQLKLSINPKFKSQTYHTNFLPSVKHLKESTKVNSVKEVSFFFFGEGGGSVKCKDLTVCLCLMMTKNKQYFGNNTNQ